MTALSQITIAGKTVDVDGEGYMQKPDQWDRSIGEEIADDVGIGELGPGIGWSSST